ncbi:unnamed protein product [Polarella glacialis]|uniref:Uncharacterized protein n=1 Tax=Polarella glacialis TaxID=89957 RepID=A0A813E5D6_POLGL|nr:unnamed protein product [Polarella glacialis]
MRICVVFVVLVVVVAVVVATFKLLEELVGNVVVVVDVVANFKLLEEQLLGMAASLLEALLLQEVRRQGPAETGRSGFFVAFIFNVDLFVVIYVVVVFNSC